MDAGSQTKKRILDSKFWMVCLIVYAAGYIFLTHRYGQVPFGDQLMFLLSQIVFVLVPGMAITMLVCPQKDKIRLVLVSYMMGIALVILELYVFYALHLQGTLLFGMCAVSLLSIWPLYKKRAVTRELPVNHRGAWALTALLAVFMTLVFFTAVWGSKTPDLLGHPAASYYQDLLWNTGTTASIAGGFPVMDIHVSGLTFSYHFFTNVFLAAFKNILGISAFTLYMKFLPLLQVIVYISALYLLFSLIAKKIWLRALCVALAFLLSTVVMWHMLWQAYATVFALSFAVMAAYFFIRNIKNLEKGNLFKQRDFILFLIFLFVSLGTKTLFGAVIAAGAGLVFLLQIIRRKNTLQMFLGGLSMIAVIGAVYLLLVYGTNTYNSLSPFQFLTPLLGENPDYYQSALASLGGALGEKGVGLLIYPYYLFRSHTVLLLGFVMLVVYLVRHKKADLTAIFLLTGIFAGVAAASVLFQPGYSNELFMEAAVPLGLFAVLYVLHDNWMNEKVKKTQKIILICVAAASFAVSIVPTVASVAGEWARVQASKNNVSAYDGISVYEYQGMMWLKENTPEDAVVASDRQYFVPEERPEYARYYYYTAFSERTSYLEGYFYIDTYNGDFQQVIDYRRAILKGVFAGDQNALASLASDGVDYLVSSEALTGEFWLDTRYGETVYENEGIRIFKLYPEE